MTARFKLFGLPVEVQPSFFLMSILLAHPRRMDSDELLRVGAWLSVVFVSILWHELGHAVVMRAFGSSARIELYSLGGLTRWGDGPHPSVVQSVVVSLAGPVAGFALGLVALVTSHLVPPAPGSAWSYASSYLVWVNLAWGALNLAPMLPLDGGHVVLALLEKVSPSRGEVATSYVSIGVAVAGCAAALWASWYWVALLAAWAGMSSIGRVSQLRAEVRDEPLWAQLEDAWEQLRSGETEEGMTATREVLLAAKSDRLRAVAAEQLAWEWLLSGDVERAEAQLALTPASFTPSQLIRGAIALRRGDAQTSVRLLEEVVAKEPEEASVHFLVEAYLAVDRLDDALSKVEGDDLPSSTVAMVVERLRSVGRSEEAERLTSR